VNIPSRPGRSRADRGTQGLETMRYGKELEIALRAARRAGEIALYHHARETETEEKADLSPVTVADRECERAICSILEDAFPLDGILGEEGAFRPRRSARRWIVDPIDGTRDFIRRVPFWANQIALEEDGEIVLGIINVPARAELSHAVAGSGCYLNDTRVTASSVDRLDRAVLLVSGFRDAWDCWGADSIRALTRGAWTVRAYSGCYDITMIVQGKSDAWLSGNGMEWDYAPAAVMARESGAAFMAKDGTARIDRGNALLCAPGLEAELRRVLGIPRRVPE